MTARRVLALVSLLAAPVWAGPYTVEQCVAASGAGQEQRQKGALFAARRELEVCADRSCPAVVQADCLRWLDEVLVAMPTVTIAARLDGVDQPVARVLLDGQPWLQELTGRPVELDPGEHVVTVFVGAQTLEQRLVIHLGEKNRLIVFQLARLTAPKVEPSPPPVPPPAVGGTAGGRGFPVVPSVFSGAAVAGAALFTGFGLSGRAALDRLVKSPCAATKACDPASVADVQRRFLVADVSLGVAVAAALVAGWQWWRWASAEPSSLTPSVAPLPGGAALQLTGTW